MNIQEKIFKRNKLKDFTFFLICFVFTVTAYFYLNKSLIKGWLGIFIFGGFSCFFLFELIINNSYLKLKKDGFEEKTLFKTKSYNWKNVSGFEIRSFRFNKRIYFNVREKSKTNFKSIQSNYNLKSEELLPLMKRYQNESSKQAINTVKH